MRIENLFEKDIFRSINGVVKADQLDPGTVWQELDEFVVTEELDRHIRSFFSVYCDSINNRSDASNASKIGVWASGFFGSGKSHFLKILSYILENKEHSFSGQKKRAVDFFENKIKDPMVYGDIKKAVSTGTDVILFNIDSKAVAGSGRDAILNVFLKVLNEKQGFCGDFPHIAHMERFLKKENKLDTFHENYKSLSGDEWLQDREAWEFHRDEVVEALSKTLGQSQQSCEKWVDSAESNFALNIENFAKWVKEYLDSKGSDHRILFLVDEIGQFIGSDTQLMLTLQTIVEELGTICHGRAWVVVTSQEDIDAVLGEMRTVKSNDFSKIQGRFKTRLSLSSKNVDEVIQRRLLSKKEECVGGLKAIYKEKGDVLKNQLSFHDIGITFKEFHDADDFVRNYPFAPYQFKLLQKIFESIRKAGATGLHLAQGERSLIDAFQYAAKEVANKEAGLLVPLYLFYPSVESFLDTSVKRTIDHASHNASLDKFDALILQVLFLIRYVDEIKGNVNNLVTLCIDEIDADRLELKRKIENSLVRLEKETLVSRNGDNFFFLTNEEQDINREVKNVELGSGDDSTLVGELIFQEIYRDDKKHRYSENKMDFDINRMCDLKPMNKQSEEGLLVSVITPFAEYFDDYTNEKCLMESAGKEGELKIILPDRDNFGAEIRNYLKTDKYIRTKDDGTLAPTTKRIHRDLADENRDRRKRIVSFIEEMLVEARYYAAGNRIELKQSSAKDLLQMSLDYLIKNSFTKMSFLSQTYENPIREIQAVLRADDIGQTLPMLEKPEGNPEAVKDIRSYIELSTKLSRQMVLNDVINRYASRPYGWPHMETLLILARLSVTGEIQFIMSGSPIQKDRVYDLITASNKWKNISIMQKIMSNPEDVKKARAIGNEVFSQMGPESQDPLVKFLREKLALWQGKLAKYKNISETGAYPGLDEIDKCLGVIRTLIGISDSVSFLESFSARKEELLDFREDIHDLEQFYEHQKPTWDKLKSAYNRFSVNKAELDRNDNARPGLSRMHEILTLKSPYRVLSETEELIRTVDTVNRELVQARRSEVKGKVEEQLQSIEKDLAAVKADGSLSEACCNPMNSLIESIGCQESLAHISQAVEEALRIKDEAEKRIAEFVKNLAKPGDKEAKAEQPKIKPKRIVRPSQMMKSAYIETNEDVEGFLGQLRSELVDAIEKNERVEIR